MEVRGLIRMSGNKQVKYEKPKDPYLLAMSKYMYCQDGWGKYWPYELMPIWLQPKYWLPRRCGGNCNVL